MQQSQFPRRRYHRHHHRRHHRRYRRRRHPSFDGLVRTLLLCCMASFWWINVRLQSSLMLVSQSQGPPWHHQPTACVEPPEELHQAEEERIQNAGKDREEWLSQILIGIPTVARPGNPDYLLQTVESLLQVGHLNESQILLFHGKAGQEHHPVLQHVLHKYPSITLVQPDRDRHAVSPFYTLSPQATDRAKLAFVEDDLSRKTWRVREAHDFLWLCRQLILTVKKATFLGFHQDDAVLVDPFPSHLNLRLDGTQPHRQILSFYSDHTPRPGRRFCYTTGGLFCGMVSFLFRRDALQDVVDGITPVYKENPIDWSFQDYLARRVDDRQQSLIQISVQASVRHLGTTSSMKGKASTLDHDLADTLLAPLPFFATHNVRFVDRIVHNCDYRQQLWHGTGTSSSDSTRRRTTTTTTTATTPLVSLGLFYTIGSNQWMQHVVLQWRTINCLRLQQLYILPPPVSALVSFDPDQLVPPLEVLGRRRQRAAAAAVRHGRYRGSNHHHHHNNNDNNNNNTSVVRTLIPDKHYIPQNQTIPSPDELLEGLARPYQGYEPHLWTRISSDRDELLATFWAKHQHHNDWKHPSDPEALGSTLAFLHVAQTLLDQTASPILGIWHDTILPTMQLNWNQLANDLVVLTEKHNPIGILSLYHHPDGRNRNGTSANNSTSSNNNGNGNGSNYNQNICGKTVDCGFHALFFSRTALEAFCHWVEPQLHSAFSNHREENPPETWPPPLSVQLVRYAQERHQSIPALLTPLTRWIGTPFRNYSAKDM